MLKIEAICTGENLALDETLGAALYAEGIENVVLFPGGIRLWEEQGRPMKQSTEPNARKSGETKNSQETQPESNTP